MGKLLYARKGSQINFDLNTSTGSNRIVTGYATIDNIDFGNDIVSKEASLKAFSNFRGNVRLQHDKGRPVGRVVDFQPAEVIDEVTGKVFQAIKVAVYISEGAEDVWKMVQDGTLSGFSIGGAVLDASKVYDKELKKVIQVINDYALLELSLVDSPMNGLANVVSIHKSLDFDTVLEKDFSSLYLFWCGTDKMSLKSPGMEATCPKCGEQMFNFGSTTEEADIAKSLEKVFSTFDAKGGQPSMEDNFENTDVVQDQVTSVDAPVDNDVEEVTLDAEDTDDIVAEDEADEADSLDNDNDDEVEDEVVADKDESALENNSDEDLVHTDKEPEVSFDRAAIEELIAELRSLMDEHGSKTAESIDGIREELATTNKSLEEIAREHEALKSTTGEIKEKLNKAEEALTETKKALEDVANSRGSLKKSLDSQSTSDRPSNTNRSVFAGVWSDNI